MRSIPLLLLLLAITACEKDDRSSAGATKPVEELTSAEAQRLVPKDRGSIEFLERGAPVKLSRAQLEELRGALREEPEGEPAACTFQPGIKVTDGPTVVLICLRCGEVRISGPDGDSERWLGRELRARFVEWAHSVFPDDPEIQDII